MGFVNTFTATGQGSLDLGGVQTVSEVAWFVVTPADLVSIDGFPPVQRIHHQAFWALTILPGAGPTAGVALARRWGYVSVFGESHIYPTTDLVEADTLYYDVFPGGVMYFEIDWP